MKKIWQNKNFRKLVWSILVLVLTFIVQEISAMPREFAPMIALALNWVIKYINVNLL